MVHGLLVLPDARGLHGVVDVLMQLMQLSYPLCYRQICQLCHDRALGKERHIFLECRALFEFMVESSSIIADCSARKRSQAFLASAGMPKVLHTLGFQS